MAARRNNSYPDYSGFIPVLKEEGITDALLNKIIDKHQNNRTHMIELYGRYRTEEESVPIFRREPRFKHGNDKIKELNNKVNNDYFGEIVDIKVGYFSGKAAVYTYSDGEEADADTQGDTGREEAAKALSDFVTRNNMYNIDMECTKFASICGYAGRLLYIDPEGNERVMAVEPFKTIIISSKEMTEPEFAVRYYSTTDIDGTEYWKAEFYDEHDIYYYEGQLGELSLKEKIPHMFDFCPLQGIPNNLELQGDAEKVLELIDAYDRTVSDNSNDIEGNTNAHMVFKNIVIDEDAMAEARESGAFQFHSMDGGDVYYLVKEINDAFNSNHLARLEDNIYRFSKTPNLNSEKFGEASGVSLKFKITGLESKCGAFEAKCQSANTYMFKTLASSLAKKRIPFDFLQCYAKYKRNFPLDLSGEATACSSLIGAGLPKRVAFENLSFIDDIDYVMELIEEEKNDIPPLTDIYETGVDEDDPEESDEEENVE